MKARTKLKRWFRRAVSATLALLLLALGGGYLALRTSLPVINGTIAVSGLTAPAEILREANGVPHIYAASEADAYYALGFVHAQDRLWQLEARRRLGAGRLSEVLGAASLDVDRFVRTLGLYRAAEQAHDALDGDTRALYQAYADGVNGYLQSHVGLLPPEFLLLGLAV
ncbi:MAG: penicillin acylase family protein, partial [Alphaproteobacteria bacterium]